MCHSDAVNLLGIRKWRPQHAVLKVGTDTAEYRCIEYGCTTCLHAELVIHAYIPQPRYLFCLHALPAQCNTLRSGASVSQGSTLHLSQARGTPDLKTLPLAGAAVAYKDISRPADAWRNLFTLILPPLADRSRGVKKYTFSATSAELQVLQQALSMHILRRRLLLMLTRVRICRHWTCTFTSVSHLVVVLQLAIPCTLCLTGRVGGFLHVRIAVASGA